MKSLRLNPEKFNIELVVEDLQKETDTDYGFASVAYTFDDSGGTMCVNDEEAEKIGKWFIALSKQLSKKA